MTQFPRSFLNSLLAALFLLCGCRQIPAATGTPAPTASATPPEVLSATVMPATEIPTIVPSATAEIAKPAVNAGLSAVNNAKMVLENGIWVTINAAGNVTATWDSAKGEWILNWETIKV